MNYEQFNNIEEFEDIILKRFEVVKILKTLYQYSVFSIFVT